MRDLLLATLAIAAGSLLGLVVGLELVPFVWPFGFLLGGVFGFVTSPVVVVGVRKKPLDAALALIYLPTGSVTLLSMVAGDPILSMAVSVVTLVIASLQVGRLLPDRPPTEGLCRACGYNLTGNVSGRCPECGMVIDAARGGQ